MSSMDSRQFRRDLTHIVGRAAEVAIPDQLEHDGAITFERNSGGDLIIVIHPSSGVAQPVRFIARVRRYGIS